MSNLFRSELIKNYNTKNRGAGIGEDVLRNGVWSMDIRPEPFYQNLENSQSGILLNEFNSNIQYVIDMWIDVDDVIYNGNNVAAGFTLRYSDNSTESFVFTGGNKGFQHKKIITPSNKSVLKLEIYYYVSMPVYYRWDSYITPYNIPKITKQGILNTTNEIENKSLTTSLSNGGIIYFNNLYEY